MVSSRREDEGVSLDTPRTSNEEIAAKGRPPEGPGAFGLHLCQIFITCLKTRVKKFGFDSSQNPLGQMADLLFHRALGGREGESLAAGGKTALGAVRK